MFFLLSQICTSKYVPEEFCFSITLYTEYLLIIRSNIILDKNNITNT